MVLVHAPALVGAWRGCFTNGPTFGSVGGCATLTLFTLFFFLKIRNVSFLRLPGDYRAWIAAGLIVATIHLDCLQPGPTRAWDSHPAIVLIVTSLVLGVFELSVSFGRRFGGKDLRRGDFSQKWRVAGWVWVIVSIPKLLYQALSSMLLRAPPAV